MSRHGVSVLRWGIDDRTAQFRGCSSTPRVAAAAVCVACASPRAMDWKPSKAKAAADASRHVVDAAAHGHSNNGQTGNSDNAPRPGRGY